MTTESPLTDRQRQRAYEKKLRLGAQYATAESQYSQECPERAVFWHNVTAGNPADVLAAVLCHLGQMGVPINPATRRHSRRVRSRREFERGY